MGLAAGRNSQALRVYKLLTDDFLVTIRTPNFVVPRNNYSSDNPFKL